MSWCVRHNNEIQRFQGFLLFLHISKQTLSCHLIILHLKIKKNFILHTREKKRLTLIITSLCEIDILLRR